MHCGFSDSQLSKRVDLTDLIGKPYKEEGRGPDAYDCYGLAIEVCRRYGIILPNYVISPNDIEMVHGIATLHHGWVECDRRNPPVPSVMAIKFNRPKINHVGVYIGNGKFIHIAQDITAHISRIDHPLWKNNIVGYYLPAYKGDG